ncbi:MAG: rhodanese-like domain-containing protein [Burkholderiales bacterium]|nr:rhodanese-like domain-containing protein [Burkholderiales bacterium]MBP7520544.1 rhodanese-like domain-containing protein [Leptothrix sp. (in: b-proteobacteria)]
MVSVPASPLRRRRALVLGAALAGLTAVCPWAWAQMDARSVSLEAARAALADGRTVVFDIREPQEHATGVAAGMKLLPMSQIGGRLGEIPKAADQPVLLICNTQNRSRKVVDALRERGFSNVRYVMGGMSSWASKGWPMVAPQR